VRVAIGQLPITYHDKEANLAAIAATARTAGKLDVEVLVLPECPLVGWLSPRARDAAEPVPGPFTGLLSDLAARHEMAIVSGLEEQAAHRTYNAAVLVGADGGVLLHHRKIDELTIGVSAYSVGDRLGVTRLGDAVVAVDICADSWGDNIIGALAQMGAQVVFTPCAFAIEPGREEANTQWILGRYQILAQRHGVTFVAANAVGRIDSGPWRGRVLHGDSLAIGPDGVVAHGARNEPDLVVVDLD
jgi:predicted amidohydrolase